MLGFIIVSERVEYHDIIGLMKFSGESLKFGIWEKSLVQIRGNLLIKGKMKIERKNILYKVKHLALYSLWKDNLGTWNTHTYLKKDGFWSWDWISIEWFVPINNK